MCLKIMFGSSSPLMKSYILLINTAKPTDGIKGFFVEFSEIFDYALDVDKKTSKETNHSILQVSKSEGLRWEKYHQNI